MIEKLEKYLDTNRIHVVHLAFIIINYILSSEFLSISPSNVLLKEVLGIFHRLVIVLGNSLQTANVSLRWKMQSQITQWIPDAKQNILLMF